MPTAVRDGQRCRDRSGISSIFESADLAAMADVQAMFDHVLDSIDAIFVKGIWCVPHLFLADGKRWSFVLDCMLSRDMGNRRKPKSDDAVQELVRAHLQLWGSDVIQGWYFIGCQYHKCAVLDQLPSQRNHACK